MARTLVAHMQALLVDENNISAMATAYLLLDPSHSLADADTLLYEWIGELDRVTGAKILDITLELKPALPPGLKSAAEAGLSVVQTGTLNFTNSGGTHLWGFSIPGLSNDPSVITDGRIVLTDGSPVANLRDDMLTAISAVAFTNDNQQDLEALHDAFISFRKRTEPVARRSFRLA